MTFKEEFPSLKGRRVYMEIGDIEIPCIAERYIKEYCLDKAKVREVLQKYKGSMRIEGEVIVEMIKELGL